MDITQLEIIMAILTAVGGIFGTGVIIGIYKNRISNLNADVDKNAEQYEKDIGNVKAYVDTSKNLYNSDMCKFKESIEKELTQLTNEIVTEIKDLNHRLKDIENNCSLRSTWVNMIPSINDRIKDIEVRVGTLPYQLSEELSKTFSNEYKNIVTILKNGKS